MDPKSDLHQAEGKGHPPPDYKEGGPKIPGTRKDLAHVPSYIDVHATTNNFRTKKGEFNYATNAHLKNTLESIIVGSIRAGDRLMHAGIIDTDICPHCNDGSRHTTLHMFWHCTYHNKCRKKAKLSTDILLNQAMQKFGHDATKTLRRHHQ